LSRPPRLTTSASAGPVRYPPLIPIPTRLGARPPPSLRPAEQPRRPRSSRLRKLWANLAVVARAWCIARSSRLGTRRSFEKTIPACLTWRTHTGGTFTVWRQAQRRALTHPNIVPIYRSWGTRRLLLLSMKLVEARPSSTGLASVPRFGRLSPCRRNFSQVAHAIHHAHQRGVLHRDLKPSNVLLDQATPTARKRFRPSRA